LLRLHYRIVDVFSDRPLAGNQLCVVLDPCPDPVQQAIAREVNLSETTFPVVTGDADYDVRIYTPATELPFAGHPTLGTAWVLGAQRWTQTSPGGAVAVEADATGAVLHQPDPVLTDVDGDPLAKAVGVPGFEVAITGNAGGLVHSILATEAPIDRLRPVTAEVAAAAAKVGAQSIAVVRRRDDVTLDARVFVAGAGIPEDPGTGSAAAAIALLARRVWNTAADVTISQGVEMGRPCRLEVHAEPGAIRVGGRISACAEGAFTL
jgi:trans-2,3-dihydro-3-hydroxyanthranilate isomerase